ncbi:hypothetical protein ACQYE5_003061 [Enterobacter cancerogenus]
MLEQLLELKKRREARLRQKLAAGNQRYERLRHNLNSLANERKSLQKSWAQLGQKGCGRLARERLHALKRELEEFFQRDKFLDEEIASLEGECAQWGQERIVLQQQIQQMRIDQEKLEWVLNEGHDAYS